MKSGLLWYDGDKDKPLWDKIDEAAQRYYDKFGVQPDTCFVHPRSLPDGKGTKLGNIRIQTSPTIQLNHIWLGVSD
jgi:hypothetical protein